MPEKNQNTGVIFLPPQPSDFKAGGETGITFETRLQDGDWTRFLPVGEKQKFGIWETNACVTFSALNCVEAQIRWMLANNKIPPSALQSLKDAGYLQDYGNGLEVNLSDRFTAKMSGTTKDGNSLQNVADSLHNQGGAPQVSWDYTQEQGATFSSWDAFWADFYANPTPDVIAKAKLFSQVFDVAYEWVYITGSALFPNSAESYIKKHLQHAPVQVLTAVGADWNNTSVLENVGCNIQHATMVYNVDGLAQFDFMDHYVPFEKVFASTYCIPYAFKIVVTPRVEAPVPAKPSFTINKTLTFGMKDPQIQNLQEILKYLGYFKLANTTDYYGTYTQQAVYAFQKASNVPTPWGDWVLNPARQVGPLTINALKNALSMK